LAEQNNAAFIWSIANLLRGPFKQSDYGKVILPFTVLRRLDCALEATKREVLKVKAKSRSAGAAEDYLLQSASGFTFYNVSPYELKSASADTANLRANLISYIDGFSPNVRDIFERYEFRAQLAKMDENDLLLLVTQRFAQLDLHPDTVSNVDMGLIFEELIRKFAEASNETAGDHFTPRDVVKLIVSLLFANDDDVLSKPGVVRSIYDPTAGTGGMLSTADDYVRHLNPEARLVLFGQERNDESYAIAKADMVIKGQDIDNMFYGDTLTNDGHSGKTFDYCISNPPFGVEWKTQQDFVEREHKVQGLDGRFGPGLPRINDGALLFLMHLIKKMRPRSEGGGRGAVILQPGPLQNGVAEKGESNIRKYLFESDLVEAIIALPGNMFYNTPIQTYILILDNHKSESKQGKVLLLDATSLADRLPKNFGDKTAFISDLSSAQITQIFSNYETSQYSKIISNEDFSYSQFPIHVPKKIRYLLNPDRADLVIASKALSKRSPQEIATLKKVISSFGETEGPVVRGKLLDELNAILSKSGFKNLIPSEVASLDKHLGIRGESFEVINDKNGNPLPDKDLDEDLLLPIGTDILAYVEREISPFVPGVWVDPAEAKVWHGLLFKQHLNLVVGPSGASEIAESLEALVGDARTALNLHSLSQIEKTADCRDSGVPWLGEVPNNWKVVPARSLFFNPNDKAQDDDVHLTPSQKYGVLPQLDYMKISGSRVVLTLSDSAQMKHVEPLDFISHLRSFQGGFELARQSGKVSGAYTIFRMRGEQDPEFWKYLFKSKTYVEALQTTTDSMRDGQSIRFREFAMVPLPDVPIAEQRKIARYLDYVTSTLAILRETPDLADLRESLISNAVTGKLNLQEIEIG
jgi:type I restriction enzyme M protein